MTHYEYICNACATARGDLPRQYLGAVRREQWAKHTTGNPPSPVNGVYTDSDTNAVHALWNEAGERGYLEIETGDRHSTNVVYDAGRSIGSIEVYGEKMGDADGIKWPNSSRASEGHAYPLKIDDLGEQVCRVCKKQIHT